MLYYSLLNPMIVFRGKFYHKKCADSLFWCITVVFYRCGWRFFISIHFMDSIPSSRILCTVLFTFLLFLFNGWCWLEVREGLSCLISLEFFLERFFFFNFLNKIIFLHCLLYSLNTILSLKVCISFVIKALWGCYF